MTLCITYLWHQKTHQFTNSKYCKKASEPFKVCKIRLDHICFEKSSSTFWQVRCCAHRTRSLLSKVRRRFFQILRPSQKTQTLGATLGQLWGNFGATWSLLLKLGSQFLGLKELVQARLNFSYYYKWLKNTKWLLMRTQK